DEVDGWWGHTIGSEWADVDNDGDFDLITCNLAHPRYIDFSNKTRLYINENGKFIDRRQEAGIVFEETHSEPCWADFNNDGFLDLYITSIYEGRRSFLYINNGDSTFEETTFLAGVRRFNGWGAACADFDNDGDVDLLVAGGNIQLFRNETNNKENWIEVRVKGKNHIDAIGTRLILSSKEISFLREIYGGKGTTNQHSLVQHFGLGNLQPPFELEVIFTDGEKKKLMINEINTILEIEE
ncbi:MAG: CRTAC1 family protein, partial [Candidatus Cloacimonetes bacterium]|nr:CRTAC1 family protein [Candidatus Cloacimonadota bacterium]